MKFANLKKIAFPAVISALSFTGIASATVSEAADPAPAAAAGNIGVVDVQKIILTVPEGKTERANLEKEVKAKEKELADMEKKLETEAQEIQGKVALMSNEARAAKQKEFQGKIMTLQQKKAQFNVEVKRKEQEATQKIARKVAIIVDGLAKEKKLNIVFETNSSGLMYVNNPVDLTDAVMKVYDKTPAPKSAKK